MWFLCTREQVGSLAAAAELITSGVGGSDVIGPEAKWSQTCNGSHLACTVYVLQSKFEHFEVEQLSGACPTSHTLFNC